MAPEYSRNEGGAPPVPRCLPDACRRTRRGTIRIFRKPCHETNPLEASMLSRAGPARVPGGGRASPAHGHGMRDTPPRRIRPGEPLRLCFTTPPRDDTGVSHIIEHSVLSGSGTVPRQGALFRPDEGQHAHVSQRPDLPRPHVLPGRELQPRRFFSTLLTVYGDAVFRPLLRKETFMQEAWRLEEAPAEDTAQGRMRFAGIVYNEMKGAYSSPDSVVSEWTSRRSFPTHRTHTTPAGTRRDPRPDNWRRRARFTRGTITPPTAASFSTAISR